MSSRLSRTRSRASPSGPRSRSGVTSSRCSKSASRSPKVAMSFAAVLSPTPGTPGMLSVESPLSALKSTIWAGAQAVALVDPGRVVDDRVLDARAGRHQPGPVGHELEHVEVAGDDRRVEPARLGLDGQRADDVVGLVPGQLVDRDPERLDDLADLRELVAQVVRHPLPGRLVLGEPLVAEGGPGQVEGHRDVVRPDVLEAAQDDAAEAEDGVHQLALRGREGREGEVSAVDEPVAVEQHQAFHRWSSAGGAVAPECTRRVRALGAGRTPGGGPLERPRACRPGQATRRPAQRSRPRPRPLARRTSETRTSGDGTLFPDAGGRRLASCRRARAGPARGQVAGVGPGVAARPRAPPRTRARPTARRTRRAGTPWPGLRGSRRDRAGARRGDGPAAALRAGDRGADRRHARLNVTRDRRRRGHGLIVRGGAGGRRGARLRRARAAEPGEPARHDREQEPGDAEGDQPGREGLGGSPVTAAEPGEPAAPAARSEAGRIGVGQPEVARSARRRQGRGGDADRPDVGERAGHRPGTSRSAVAPGRALGPARSSAA